MASPAQAVAWLKAHATLGSQEAETVLRVWSGFLHDQDAIQSLVHHARAQDKGEVSISSLQEAVHFLEQA